ncbi:unknown protein [Seminavis robusta]|uniref:Uncharacterized protein n=1 Tax=Seminavis robusta TaxID=568900 RepID=A0A9N8F427_9STRA|nr:unknown protein [Seminavis robusta]|eukprot:Sro3479_g348450.1 n/a (141) ;mRNA; r:1817-2239
MKNFTSPRKLQDVGHGGDTQVNESLNNLISHYAPKNRTYCGSVSLRNRVPMAIGVHLLGYDVFFRRLFARLGMEVEEGTDYFLRRLQKVRDDEAAKIKKVEHKKKRKKEMYDKLLEYQEMLREDRDNNRQYKAGIALDSG